MKRKKKSRRIGKIKMKEKNCTKLQKQKQQQACFLIFDEFFRNAKIQHDR